MSLTFLQCADGELACVWYDYDTASWLDSGCTVTDITSRDVTCSCTHLTNFAIMMRPETEQVAAVNGTLDALMIITYGQAECTDHSSRGVSWGNYLHHSIHSHCFGLYKISARVFCEARASYVSAAVPSLCLVID